MKHQCYICLAYENVLTLCVQNSSVHLCPQCYQDLERHWRLLKFMDHLNMSKAGTWGGAGMPRPCPNKAKNPHEMMDVVLGIDDQSSLGLFQCKKCGGRWVLNSKHQAQHLTAYSECPFSDPEEESC